MKNARIALLTLLTLACALAIARPAEAGRASVEITTVGNLPATCTPNPGHQYIVTDGNATDGSDCSTGGGSTITICFCNAAGTGYVAEADFSPSSDPDTDHDFTDEIDFTDIVQTNTLAGNPALLVDECFPVATASGGGFICEGSTADGNEMLFLVPDLNEADTTHRLVTETATQTLTNKSISGAQINSGTVPDAQVDGSAEEDEITHDNLTGPRTATALAADALDAHTEIDQGLKTASNDTDDLAVWNGAIPGSSVCVQMNASGQLVSAGDTCANLGPGGSPKMAASWTGWQLNADGTNCESPFQHTFNGGPQEGAVRCADSNSSILYGSIKSDDYGGGNLVFNLAAVNENGTPSGILDFDFSAQCRGDSDAMNATWGTAQSASITFDTSDDLEVAATATVTPDGTCAADDAVFWRAVMDATATTTQVADTYIVSVHLLEQ